MEKIIEVADPALHKHLLAQGLTDAVVYSYSCTCRVLSHCGAVHALQHGTSCLCVRAGVSSLSASVPPFAELIQLWDFLIAFGIHLNVVCVAAQIILLRDQLLATDA